VSRRAFVAGTLATGAALGVRGLATAAPTSPALFVAAHPDDETLAMGVALAEHAAAGQDVHLLLLTRGELSSARDAINGTTGSSYWGVAHSPADEGYAPLDEAAFGQARIDEAHNAAHCLSTGLGAVTVHEAGLVNGGLTTEQAAAAVLAVADLIAPGGAVRIKTHSHIVDNHSDHLAAGQAARTLRDSHPDRFADLRHYVLPSYWADPRLGQLAGFWDHPTDTGIRLRVVNACRAYGAWAPPHSYAVGYHSVATQFAQLVANPRCLVHA
jgi:LmbE family N-acetylglucosaminyl deacetylase